MVVYGLHHVQIAMPEGGEARAVAFYQGLLGIPRVAKPSHLEARGGCWFESDTVRIHLGVEREFKPAKRAHPALLMEDLDTMGRRLVEAGLPVVDDEPLPGFERFYTSEPFGNRIELLTPAPQEGVAAGEWCKCGYVRVAWSVVRKVATLLLRSSGLACPRPSTISKVTPGWPPMSA